MYIYIHKYFIYMCVYIYMCIYLLQTTVLFTNEHIRKIWHKQVTIAQTLFHCFAGPCCRRCVCVCVCVCVWVCVCVCVCVCVFVLQLLRCSFIALLGPAAAAVSLCVCVCVCVCLCARACACELAVHIFSHTHSCIHVRVCVNSKSIVKNFVETQFKQGKRTKNEPKTQKCTKILISKRYSQIKLWSLTCFFFERTNTNSVNYEIPKEVEV